MKQLEIEELRDHITDAVREVQQGETIEVVSDGNVVALLVPALPDAAERRAALARHNAPAETGKHATEPTVVDAEKVREALASLDALRAEMDKYVTGPIDVTQMLSEMRGRLE